MTLDADVLVVGSGFGGSVAALRAVEKGHRVLVLEAGRRFADADLPRTTWDLRRFLWAPRLGCTGIQRIRLLRDVLVLSGAGVGGGSLVYANTLYPPPPSFYADPQWRGITDWQAELGPHLDQASRMLGVADNPDTTVADEVFAEVARDMGVGQTFRLTPVGVFFGDGAQRRGTTVPDPFFGGAGPDRQVCTRCGSCMSGCRVGAKNTLVKNYLWLAEHAGVGIRALTTVTDLHQDPDGTWLVRTVPTGAGRRSRRATVLRAREVVLAAGALGTQALLQRLAAAGTHPGLSSRIGELTRTNSEAIHAAVRDERTPAPGAGGTDRRRSADHSRGIAISSSIHPDEHTHVEPCRYGRGSNLMALLGTVLVGGDDRAQRLARFAAAVARHPVRFASGLSVRRWSERGFVLLTMQSHDNSITVSPGRGGRLTSRPGPGVPSPRSIPQAHEVTRRVAEKIGGRPRGSWTEIADIPVTAHILGGAVIGPDAARGVLDPWQRVFGAPGLHVLDGAAVSANLGVNPSLTITAQAERAMSFWPNAGTEDPRPPLGAAYRPVPGVAPRLPAVPAGAPGELSGQPTGRTPEPISTR